MMTDQDGFPVQPIVPMNPEAEQALLGALLRDNTKLALVTRLLAPDRFSDPIHGVIFMAICKIVEAGVTADTMMISAEFDGTGALDEVGGLVYVYQLAALETRADIQNYVESIHDAWVRRELIRVAEHLHALAADTIQGAYGEAISDDFGEASAWTRRATLPRDFAACLPWSRLLRGRWHEHVPRPHLRRRRRRHGRIVRRPDARRDRRLRG